MTDLLTEKNTDIKTKDVIKNEYLWSYSNIFIKLQNALKEFFQKGFEIRFMGLSLDENILFYGDEYFVNKIKINKTSDFITKISSNVIKLLLDSALGEDEKPFELKKLTGIEASLIKSFSCFVYENIQDSLNKEEISKKQQSCPIYNFTFFVRDKNKHAGKIIISLPSEVIPEAEEVKYKEVFSINDYKKTFVSLRLCVGKSRMPLNDIKAIEIGDIIVLEDSNINKMSVIYGNTEVGFVINPDPSLIISLNNNGGNEMEEETSAKTQNMWDSILVDVVAEFDNVKLTLGELKQISEGLVIDVGSVYENKIKLRVENQVVATGELVILNDRYGVRIDSVKKSKEPAAEPVRKPQAQKVQAAAAKPAPKPAPQAAKPAPNKKEADAKGDENFDYSDFEIEDESI